MLIQPVLIVGLVFIAVSYRFRMRSKLLDRAIVFGLAMVGIILVSSPSLSTAIAHLLGVGRGVDLVIYLSLVGIGFCGLLVFSKIRFLENQITILVREIALIQAEREQRERR